MGAVDLLIVGALIGGGVAGWRLGLVTRVATWLLMAVGLVAAIRLLPWVVGRVGDGGGMWPTLVAVAVVFVGLAVGQSIGLALGSRLGGRRSSGAFGVVDRTGGAALGIVGILAVVWLLLPVFASTPGLVARTVADSRTAQALDRWLPDPPDAVQGLRSLVGDGPFPQVFESLRPTPDLGPPPSSTGIDAATSGRVRAAVVRVEASGCGRMQNGTGFVAGSSADGATVLTNAHVVAGSESIEVRDARGRYHRATTIAFDPRSDLAVLVVATLGGSGLALAEPVVEMTAGVYGHPGGGDLRIAPARVAGVVVASGRDIYGQAGARREVLELAADLAPGDSGSPVVDASGQVVGVVFAVAADRPGVAYALSPDEVAPVLAAARGARETSTGSCIV